MLSANDYLKLTIGEMVMTIALLQAQLAQLQKPEPPEKKDADE